MQMYFTKATYTNNVYKISDFFVAGNYKTDLNKSLNINFRPNDGLSRFITKQILLPDATSIWEYTHVTVPEYNKIYKIVSVDYLNNEQYEVILDEDPLLSEYITLENTDIIMSRSNDLSLFRGVHDIADLELESTEETTVIESPEHTGKWALLFFQYDDTKTSIGLRFAQNSVYYQILENTFSNLVSKYPEVTTNTPEKYSYFNAIALLSTPHIGRSEYQCTYTGGKLRWVAFVPNQATTVYFDVKNIFGALPTKVSQTDVLTYCVALPFDSTLYSTRLTTNSLVNFSNFIGPIDTNIIDIKIMDDLFLKTASIADTWNPNEASLRLERRITWESLAAYEMPIWSDAAMTVPILQDMISLVGFRDDLDISAPYVIGTPSQRDAEPFFKYELYVYGRKIQVPYYLSDDIHILLAMNSGVINYIVYYNTIRNVLASGSFTHSIKYQIDQLDSFYSQNPTYKDQFFAKMAIDSVKTFAGGAIGGSVVPGLGTAAGAGLGLVSAGVDAGVSLLNLYYQEKGLRLKPDQMFGENSEVSLQVLNIFGIYWVKKTPENLDFMRVEYDLKGFPCNAVKKIADLNYQVSDTFPSTKIVFGEIKKVVKNQYATDFINEKLKQGIILIQ